MNYYRAQTGSDLPGFQGIPVVYGVSVGAVSKFSKITLGCPRGYCFVDEAMTMFIQYITKLTKVSHLKNIADILNITIMFISTRRKRVSGYLKMLFGLKIPQTLFLSDRRMMRILTCRRYSDKELPLSATFPCTDHLSSSCSYFALLNNFACQTPLCCKFCDCQQNRGCCCYLHQLNRITFCL